MEELFMQSFNHARITLFRNYSDIGDRSVVYETKQQGRWEDPQDDWDRFLENSGPPPDHFVGLRTSTEQDVMGAEIVPIKKYVVSMKPAHGSLNPLRLVNLPLYKKNNRNFFHTTNPSDYYNDHSKVNSPRVDIDVVKLVSLKPKRDKDGYQSDFFETIKDRQIKRHFNNPFAEIEIFKTERWIKRDGNKIKIKLYHQTKSRRLGGKYFRVSATSTTVSFDLVKGNFLCITYESGRGKRRNPVKHFYSNSFQSLETSLNDIFRSPHPNILKRTDFYPSFHKTFSFVPFVSALTKVLGIDPKSASIDIPDFGLSGDKIYVKKFVTEWTRRFVKLKKIKLPNDGYHLLTNYYPTERYLKKNDRKLVASILDRLGILSKYTVKLLHKHPDTDLYALFRLCKILGENNTKYLGNINHLIFCKGFRDVHIDVGIKHMLINHIINYGIATTENEKENVVHILNDGWNTRSIRGAVDELSDHFIMMDRLRPYYPEISLTARKWNTFSAEHSRLSALERNIKKGYSTHNIFSKEIIDYIEKPIESTQFQVFDEPVKYIGSIESQEELEKLFNIQPCKAIRRVYQPVLLRTSEDYIEEGAYMHHCVAGYIDHSRSIIVSLRCGEERVTCEFYTDSKKCYQARYYQNQSPPEHFKEPLQKLSDRIMTSPHSIQPIEKQHVPLLINGKPIVPEVLDLIPNLWYY